MARFRYESYRLGETTIALAGGAQTIGSVPCSTLVSGMSNGTQLIVDCVVMLMDDTQAASLVTPYTALVTLTAGLLLTSGPTYTLSSVTKNTVGMNGGGAGGAETYWYSVLTMDINSGNLRVRITPGSGVSDITAWAQLNTAAR